MVFCDPTPLGVARGAACFLAGTCGSSFFTCDGGNSMTEGWAKFVKVTFRPGYAARTGRGHFDLEYSAGTPLNAAGEPMDSESGAASFAKASSALSAGGKGPYVEKIYDNPDNDANVSKMRFATLEDACISFTDEVELHNSKTLAALTSVNPEETKKPNLRGGNPNTGNQECCSGVIDGDGSGVHTVGFYRGNYGVMGKLKKWGLVGVGGLIVGTAAAGAIAATGGGAGSEVLALASSHADAASSTLGEMATTAAHQVQAFAEKAGEVIGNTYMVYTAAALVIAPSIFGGLKSLMPGTPTALETDKFAWKEEGSPCIRRISSMAGLKKSKVEGTCMPKTLVDKEKKPTKVMACVLPKEEAEQQPTEAGSS
ncbi:unnamed protein product [Amoebophrya sp. A25]|nr:unnamed protein product [Amoebophrya sp. A25]|eukprot:GSA25T00001377001.1